jgi:hypothetical protein
MAMLTKPQLIKALNTGDFEGAVKELRRYGSIIRDVSWDCDEGFYKGANRCLHIDYKGLFWRVSMLNGEVREVGYTKKITG